VILLDHITALKGNERETLVHNFRQLEGLSTTMPPEMFIERFGPYLQRPQTIEPVFGFWRRLWHRLVGK
jgi:hypothetical protein